MQRIHLFISGDVQGVGFRAFVLRQAQNTHLNGWVKNRKDDTVELIAEGSKDDLDDLIQACQKGPEVAWVEHIDVIRESATNEFVGFEVLY